jgi:hypothetical protein
MDGKGLLSYIELFKRNAKSKESRGNAFASVGFDEDAISRILERLHAKGSESLNMVNNLIGYLDKINTVAQVSIDAPNVGVSMGRNDVRWEAMIAKFAPGRKRHQTLTIHVLVYRGIKGMTKRQTLDGLRLYMRWLVGADGVDERPLDDNEKRMEARFELLKKLVEGGGFLKFPGSLSSEKYSERAPGQRQTERWVAIARMLMPYADDRRCEWIIPMLADKYRGFTKPADLDSPELPVQIRSTENPPPAMHAAVLTRRGADIVMVEANERKVEAPDWKGFISPETRGQMRVEGDVVQLGQHRMPILRTAAEKTEGAYEHGYEGCISHSESWPIRFKNEANRHLPFNMATYYQLWAHLLFATNGVESDITPDEEQLNKIFVGGLDHLLFGIGVIAVEWHSTHSKARAGRKEEVTLRRLISAWVSKTPIRLPDWIYELRKGRVINYVPATDFGYQLVGVDVFTAHAQEEDKFKSEAKKKDKHIFVDVEDEQMPFVEREGSAPRLTNSARTSHPHLMVFFALSSAISKSDSSHLDEVSGNGAFSRYYRDVLDWSCNSPGAKAKAMQKAMFPLWRILLAMPRTVTVPQKLPNMHGVFNGGMMNTPYVDDHTRIFMGDFFKFDDPDQSFDVLIEKAIEHAEETANMGVSARLIYDAWREAPCTAANHAFLDVIIHLQRPDAVVGYHQTTHATIGVYGYASDAQKWFDDKVDNRAVPDDIGYQNAFYGEAMTKAVSYLQGADSYARSVSKSMTGRSGGRDAVTLTAMRSKIVGTKAPAQRDMKMRKKINVKTVTMSAFADVLLEDSKLTEQPSSIGYRSVPARVLRIIYNVAIKEQLPQHFIYQAIGEMFKTFGTRFTTVAQSGEPVEDSFACILSSLEMSLPEFANAFCAAEDASALDQHEGTGDRQAIIDAAAKFENIEDDLSRTEGFEISYAKMLKQVMEKRNGAHFEIRIEGAPTQYFYCNTMTSGDLLTTYMNSVKTHCMQEYMSEATGFRPEGSIMGDDVYMVFPNQPPLQALDLIKEREVAARRCGQLYSLDKSASGKLVHYLQIAWWAGQRIPRRMALDHERPAEVTLTSMGSMISKYLQMSMRGGNTQTANMLMMLTIAAGARERVFGKEFVHGWEVIFNPGGALNIVPLGFPSANNKIYLALNAQLFGLTGEMEKIVDLEQSRTIGERVTSNLMSATINVASSARSDVSVQDHIDRSWNLMKENKRVSPLPADLPIRTSKSLVGVSYSDWNRNTFYEGVGDYFKKSDLKKWFTEKALLEAGFIPERRGDTAFSPKSIPMKTPDLDHTFRFGDKTITVTWSSYTIVAELNKSSTSPYNFCLYSSTNKLREYTMRWHPFWSSRNVNFLFFSLFGVGGRGESLGSARSALKAFDPSHFRKDMTPEAVVSILMRTGSNFRSLVARHLGFTMEETSKMMRALPNVAYMEDVQEIDDYSSTTDPMKSMAVDRLRELFGQPRILIGTMDDEGGQSYERSLLRMFADLLYSEINVNVSLGLKLDEGPARLCRIPCFTIS